MSCLKSHFLISQIERRLVDADEVVSIRTEYLSDLAIAEFERTMAQFDFQTKDGFSVWKVFV